MIGARATFCAGHKLPQHQEVHGHSYEVWAYTDDHLDVEEWQRKLKRVCADLFDHRMLPPELAKMEYIALKISGHIGAKRVVVSRPVEGLSAQFTASGHPWEYPDSRGDSYLDEPRNADVSG